MIAYFDTSSIVPLLVDEPATDRCQEHWDAADRVVTVRLARVEAHAALAQAERSGRMSSRQLGSAVMDLDELLGQVDHVEVDDELVRAAAALAEAAGLRAYDAVHLAAALHVADRDLVVVAGDRSFLAAATTAGLTIAQT
ncbi:MAG: type II toxin-antitoxin system VapC family toxin [Actinobacteria bacterium]|nr:type II toxin-antitoxin system VapC family toxin [Actinomycetota bacterium]